MRTFRSKRLQGILALALLAGVVSNPIVQAGSRTALGGAFVLAVDIDGESVLELREPADGGAWYLEVTVGSRSWQHPLSAREEAFLRELRDDRGQVVVTEQEIEILERAIDSVISTDAFCSPEEFWGCYNDGAEECFGRGFFNTIGGGAGAYALGWTVTGAGLGAGLGFLVADGLTCSGPIWFGCLSGCVPGPGPGGGWCMFGSTCQDGPVCPNNTTPTGQACNGGDGRCCQWNGPYGIQDNCMPPAICYDNWSCPSGTEQGSGVCVTNEVQGRGECCIPTTW